MCQNELVFFRAVTSHTEQHRDPGGVLGDVSVVEKTHPNHCVKSRIEDRPLWRSPKLQGVLGSGSHCPRKTDLLVILAHKTTVRAEAPCTGPPSVWTRTFGVVREDVSVELTRLGGDKIRRGSAKSASRWPVGDGCTEGNISTASRRMAVTFCRYGYYG